MSAKPLHVMLVAAVILSTIAPVPTFAEFKKTEWDVQELYKQWMFKNYTNNAKEEVLAKFFVWNLFHAWHGRSLRMDWH